MNVNVRGLQRNVKNVVKNYSEAQVKVREATSNDPWGPSSTLMGEIADLTYNVVAFSEIMQMIWKRLNDHGKNWRHVYKALVLLEYLIKTGTEKVAQQCKENIFAIQTLKDFQYMEENKDQGMNVREKSKNLVALLKDDEKLRNERARALKAKERFAQSISHISNSPSTEGLPKVSSSYHDSLNDPGPRLTTDLENARPQTIGEEELQLQLALAMSKEEAEQEERQRKNDDLRLKLALTESEKNKLAKKSAMEDLLEISVSVPVQQGAAAASDPWGEGSAPLNGATNSLRVDGTIANNLIKSSVPVQQNMNDPWSASPGNQTMNNDPWSNKETRSSSATNDPWNPSPTSSTPVISDPWSSNQSGDKNDISIETNSSINDLMNSMSGDSSNMLATRKTPESFLGANSNLVNLDALISSKTTTSLPVGGNPFALSTATATIPATSNTVNNPFQNSKPPPPTINELRSQNQFPLSADSINISSSENNSVFGHNSSNSHTNNPFAM